VKPVKVLTEETKHVSPRPNHKVLNPRKARMNPEASHPHSGKNIASHDHGRRRFLQLLGLISLAPFAERLAFAQAIAKVPETDFTLQPNYFGHFAELPVGAVKPLGWTKAWLERQGTGLTGHPENMGYPFDTCMLGGHIPAPSFAHGDNWWRYEQSGYFFDGVTRLNHLIDDPNVQRIHRQAIDEIMTGSSDSGYGTSVFAWPNAVIGRGVAADYSAASTPAERAAFAAVIERVVLPNPWPHGRDGVNAETGLYLYAHTGDPRFLDFATQAYKNYLSDTDSFCTKEKITGSEAFNCHGVTAAESLKMLALMYLYSGDPEALSLTTAAFEKVIAKGLMPDGVPVSSEFLGTAEFNSLHETCDISDWTWSMGYCLMTTGDPKWADIIERSIFNALPGAVTKDFKQFQYFSSANQVLATSTSSHNVLTRMSYRAAHDTECCGGNVNRAMPNYVIRQWMKLPASSERPGVAAVFYGPSELTAEIAGQLVIIIQTTDYPFRDTITFKVQTKHPVFFDLTLRIPTWCKSAMVTVNKKPYSGKLDPGTFSTISRLFKNKDVIQLKLPMEVRTEDWFDGQSTVFVRGPLVYTLDITEKRVEVMKDTPHVEESLNGNLIQGFPAVEFTPVSEWRFGIDPAIRADLTQIKVVETEMSVNPFVPGQAPVHLELPLRLLPNWKPEWTAEPALDANGKPVYVVNPQSLPKGKELEAIQAPTPQKLVPYGATHLRLTTLPVIRSEMAPASSGASGTDRAAVIEYVE